MTYEYINFELGDTVKAFDTLGVVIKVLDRGAYRFLVKFEDGSENWISRTGHVLGTVKCSSTRAYIRYKAT